MELACAAKPTLFPSGRAVTPFKGTFEPLQSLYGIFCGSEPYTERPDKVSTIGVQPDGTVSVCGQEGMSIQEFLDGYDPHADSALRTFASKGVEGLIEIAEAHNVKFQFDDYYSPCEACTALRNKIRRSTQRQIAE